MFGQEPGAERRHGVMNQHIVTKLEADDVAYFVLHTRGEDARSVLISALTKHYADSKPKKSAGEVNDFVVRLVSAITSERAFLSVAEYDRMKEEKVLPPGKSEPATIESIVATAKSSCVLGIVKKVADE